MSDDSLRGLAPADPDADLQHDVYLDELEVPAAGRRHVHLRDHVSLERVPIARGLEELVPIEAPPSAGPGFRHLCDDVFLEVYYRQPRWVVGVALGPVPGNPAALGRVAGPPRQEGLTTWPIAKVQAWRDRAGNVLVFWEVVPQFRQGKHPGIDLRPWWDRAEAWLVAHLGPAEVVTPGWDPAYETLDLRHHLAELGYRPDGRARHPGQAWSKRPPRMGGTAPVPST